MMAPMTENGQRPRALGIATAAGLVLLVLLAPILFLGGSPSLFTLLLGAGILVAAGILVRIQGGPGPRTVGTILVVVGVLLLFLVVGLLAIALGGWGRPY
jgi:asparagine N-glycosylation enzyme membrane subunit Stt3